jgi:hypothetical protein
VSLEHAHSYVAHCTKYFIANDFRKINKDRTSNTDGESTFIRRIIGWDLLDFGACVRAVLKLISDKQVTKIHSRGSDALGFL